MRRRSLLARLMSGASVLLALAQPFAAAAQATPSAAPSPAAGQTWFIFLETGKPVPDDREAVAQMQRGHLENFKRLYGEGKLSAAGPLRDPARLKRGIVVVQAPSREALAGYFQPDAYVREGYMTVNAQPAEAMQPLLQVGVDPGGIEEGRIVLISRGAPELREAQHAHLRKALELGTAGAWYSLKEGPVAEVLFVRTTNDSGVRIALAGYPGLAGERVTMEIWPQWLGKGVLR